MSPGKKDRRTRQELLAEIEQLRSRLDETEQTTEASQEALRRATSELIRLNQDLEQFAYAAGHDMQEPLRVIGMFLSLLSDRYGSQLDDKGREFIGYASDAARRMSQLISDLLAYSRVDRRGKLLEPFDANHALTTALADLRASIEVVAAAVTNDTLPTVLADGSQLTQLLRNLIGNAIKFRQPGRPLRIHVGAEQRDGKWVIFVRDNGIGIAAEQHERIFQVFQRLHAREQYPGTGIGLAVCKRIVERHGGRIWVESKPGEGCTLYFSLPQQAPRKDRCT